MRFSKRPIRIGFGITLQGYFVGMKMSRLWR
nr:MAG TPA: hypothetical protein [Caudoviricetes sp.]